MLSHLIQEATCYVSQNSVDCIFWFAHRKKHGTMCMPAPTCCMLLHYVSHERPSVFMHPQPVLLQLLWISCCIWTALSSQCYSALFSATHCYSVFCLLDDEGRCHKSVRLSQLARNKTPWMPFCQKQQDCCCSLPGVVHTASFYCIIICCCHLVYSRARWWVFFTKCRLHDFVPQIIYVYYVLIMSLPIVVTGLLWKVASLRISSRAVFNQGTVWCLIMCSLLYITLHILYIAYIVYIVYCILHILYIVYCIWLFSCF